MSWPPSQANYIAPVFLCHQIVCICSRPSMLHDCLHLHLMSKGNLRAYTGWGRYCWIFLSSQSVDFFFCFYYWYSVWRCECYKHEEKQVGSFAYISQVLDSRSADLIDNGLRVYLGQCLGDVWLWCMPPATHIPLVHPLLSVLFSLVPACTFTAKTIRAH